MSPRGRTPFAILDLAASIITLAIGQGIIHHGWPAFLAGSMGLIGSAGLLWPRRRWSDKEKIARSRKLIEAGKRPLDGYEWVQLPPLREPEE
jgi:hypothetical protein